MQGWIVGEIERECKRLCERDRVRDRESFRERVRVRKRNESRNVCSVQNEEFLSLPNLSAPKFCLNPGEKMTYVPNFGLQ